MPLLEKTIEESVVAHAKKRGCLIRKMNGLGARGWPDRMFLFAGRTLFIEFKKPGGAATPQQAAFHQQMMEKGFPVFVIDDIAAGKSLIDTFLEAPEVT